jgi:hypothetical protein
MSKVIVADYSVTLKDHPGLRTGDRLIAEDRFRVALEGALGARRVPDVFRAWANPPASADAQAPDVQDAERWIEATRHARMVALRGLSAPPGSYFEVSVPQP